MRLALVAVLALSLSSCAAMKQFGMDLAACAVGSVPSAVAGVVPMVQSQLQSQSPDWAAGLEALGLKVGIDVVLCAVHSVMGDVVQRARKAEGVNVDEMMIYLRGQAYLGSHGVKVAH